LTRDHRATTTLIEPARQRFPDAVAGSHTYRGDVTVVLRRGFLLDVVWFLKEDRRRK
jgi:hypothetical protein